MCSAQCRICCWRQPGYWRANAGILEIGTRWDTKLAYFSGTVYSSNDHSWLHWFNSAVLIDWFTSILYFCAKNATNYVLKINKNAQKVDGVWWGSNLHWEIRHFCTAQVPSMRHLSVIFLLQKCANCALNAHSCWRPVRGSAPDSTVAVSEICTWSPGSFTR